MKRITFLFFSFLYIGCTQGTGSRPPITSSNTDYGCACGGAVSTANLYCCQPSDSSQPVYINFTGQGCSAGATATTIETCGLSCSAACQQYNP